MDLKFQTLIKTIEAHKKPINNIKFSEKWKKICNMFFRLCVKIWDFNSGKIIDSVKLKTIPQIAIFNKKENGYLIFTNDGKILEKKV